MTTILPDVEVALELVYVRVEGKTVKLSVLVVVCPEALTEIVPEVALLGTETVREVVVAAETIAVEPLNRTVLPEVEETKFVPVMVILAPGIPRIGVKLVMVGAGVVAFEELDRTAKAATVVVSSFFFSVGQLRTKNERRMMNIGVFWERIFFNGFS